MATLHTSTRYNVEATINAWLQTQITGFTLPSFYTGSITVVFNRPELGIVTPSISIDHIPVDVLFRSQGRNVGSTGAGGHAHGMMDISCWESRKVTSWQARIRVLAAIVEQIVSGTSELVINNYLTSQTSPTATTFKVNLSDVEVPRQFEQDTANPDIMRGRTLVSYHWTLRSA